MIPSNYKEWQHMNTGNVLGDNINIGNLYHDLMALISQQSTWSQATFGTDKEKSAVGGLVHLSKEALETVLAIRKKESRERVLEEFADCLLLLLDGLRREGYVFTELVKAAWTKQQINRKREWNVQRWQYVYESVTRANEQDHIQYKCTATKKVPDMEIAPSYTEYGDSPVHAHERVLKHVRDYEDSITYEHIRQSKI